MHGVSVAEGGLAVFGHSRKSREVIATITARFGFSTTIVVIFDYFSCCRLKAHSRTFQDGWRHMKAFHTSNIKSLTSLPIMIGDEYEQVLQWLVLIIQDGDGILDESATLVRPQVLLVGPSHHSHHTADVPVSVGMLNDNQSSLATWSALPKRESTAVY